MVSKNEYKVQLSGAGRLDKLLAEAVEAQLPELGLTRSRLQAIIQNGVLLNGVECRKPGLPVVDAEVRFVIVEQKVTHAPHKMDLDVVFDDDQLCVINKPAGLVVHPGAGNSHSTLVNVLVGMFPGIGSGDRPGIVHRLDKDTTGLIVVAKNVSAQNALATQFASRTVGREYMALALTTPRARRTIDLADSGQIATFLARHPNNRKIFCATDDVKGRGRRAVTNWRVVERLSHGTLLALKLETGRTHQIRVHLDSIGSPVIGDQTYGDFSPLPKPLQEASKDFGRQALHAATLEFDHPTSGKRLKFTAPIPSDMEQLISTFRAYATK